LSICAVEFGVVVVVRNVCEGATGGHLDSHSRYGGVLFLR
jgi:hypothetical protein